MIRILPAVRVRVQILHAQYQLTRIHRRLYGDFQAIGAAVLAGDATQAEQAARALVQNVRAGLEAELAAAK